MKTIEKFVLKACSYAVLIVTLFFLFTLITDFTEAALRIGTFMLILLFGFIISIADLIFRTDRINMALRLLIHYASLLVTFIVVFVVFGNIAGGGGGAVISAVFIFTALYAVIFTVVYFLKRSARAADKWIDNRSPKKQADKKPYTSLYGKDNK
jgi:hypothetical protein